eukprot:TRINITY_DN2773_c0_g1_i1.p1 TRINITY_DN2773_c0_g1~~TRINITY_DN2773_c0_g1_i1.p1  ORF type:complete len:716 (-),score=127.00 TRINITY_DN2773_c0_g1_i1:82-2229(-)
MSSRIYPGAQEGPVSVHYRVGKQLGTGAFSVVSHVTHRESGREAAVKVIDTVKHRHQADLLKSELKVLSLVKGNPHIVELIDVYEDDSSLSLVLELVQGGELFDKIAEKGYYSEKEGSKILRTIVEAVHHCHSVGVIHRDLKPENLLCGSQSFDNLTDLKLTDFGASIYVKKGEKVTGGIGSPSYCAPEVITNVPYDHSVDMWSVGVISYIVLGGYAPFDKDLKMPLNLQITTAAFEFHDEEWAEVGASARDFISKLLVVDPKKRLTAAEALAHPFISNGSVLGTNALAQTHQRFARFNARRKFRASVLSVMATNRLGGLLGTFKKKKANSLLPTAQKDTPKTVVKGESTQPKVIDSEEEVIPEDTSIGVSLSISNESAEPSQVIEVRSGRFRATTSVDDLPRTIIPSSVYMHPLESQEAITQQRFELPSRGDPQVTWNISSPTKSAGKFQLFYETLSLYWSASYIAIVSADSLSLQLEGSYNIINHTGKTFVAPSISLLHGEEQLVLSERVKQLADNQELRIVYLPPTTVTVEPVFTLRICPYYSVEENTLFVSSSSQSSQSGHCRVLLRLSDVDSSQNLLKRLPQGLVRVYQKPPLSQKLLSSLPSSELTYSGGKVSIAMPEESLLTGHRFQSSFTHCESKKEVRECIRIVLKNDGDDVRVVRVEEELYRWTNGQVQEVSQPHTLTNSLLVITVTIPANSTQTLSYTAIYTYD